MTGSLLFIVAFVLQDILQAGFHWQSRAVSEHALGSYGWIQIASFVVTGFLLIVFARGVAEAFRQSPGSRLGPFVLSITGACLLLSGPFVTDPAPVAAFSSAATLRGNIHAVLGAIAFTLMPLSCFLFYRAFRKDGAWRSLAGWTLAACIVIVLAIMLMKLAQLGLAGNFLGLFQRVVLLAYFGWIFAFAFTLESSS